MQVGNVFIKFIVRKLQGNGNSTQIIALAGFDPRLTVMNAVNVESLSPNHVLTQAEVDAVIAKLVKCNSASGYTDITNGAVQKKMAKLLGEPEFTIGDIGKETFESLGVGRYL